MDCPSDGVLRDFRGGNLGEVVLTQVGAHLSECPACDRRYDAILEDRDPWIDALRIRPHRWPEVKEPQLQRLIDSALGFFGNQPRSDESQAAEKATPRHDGQPVTDHRRRTAAKPPPAADSRARRRDTQPADPLPRLPDRYARLKLTGEGGFARVYRARDQQLGRDVAIKISRRDRFDSGEQFHRFLAEARRAAALNHPGVVTVYDVLETDDGDCGIVMEYLPGRALSDRADWLKLPTTRVVETMIAVAETVDHMHRQGVLHRDLKPANILIDQDDREGQRVRVADFGMAVADHALLDHAGQVAGTVYYMSPEQLEGRTKTMDGRSDVWSLGVILYQLLSGKLPFSGSRADVVEQVLGRDPWPPRQYRAGIPEELQEICLRCLRRDPHQRLETAGDLAALLRRWLADNGQAARRRLGLVAAVGCVLLGVVIASAFAFPGGDTGTTDAGAGRPTTGDGAPVELPPRTFKFQEWTDLFDRDPTLVPPRPGERNVRWVRDDAKRMLDVSSRDYCLLSFAHVDWSDFAVRVDVDKTHWSGKTGLFLGMHPDLSQPDQDVWKSHHVYLNRVGPTTKLTIQTVVWTPLDDGGVASNQQPPIAIVKVNDPPLRKARLEVEVRYGKLRKVVWDGVDLSKRLKLRELANDLLAVPPGELGTLNSIGDTAFHDLQLMKLTTENAPDA